MKPKNFPARKLLRAANAQGRLLSQTEIAAARGQRTKKDRRNNARLRGAA